LWAVLFFAKLNKIPRQRGLHVAIYK